MKKCNEKLVLSNSIDCGTNSTDFFFFIPVIINPIYYYYSRPLKIVIFIVIVFNPLLNQHYTYLVCTCPLQVTHKTLMSLNRTLI